MNDKSCSTHILLVTHYFPTHGGGIEIVAGELQQALISDGLRITWFASNTDAPPPAHEYLLPVSVNTWNIFERRFGLPIPLWSPRGFYQLWRAVKACDLLHIHDYLYFGNIAAFIFAKIHAKPTMITQHIGGIPYKNWLLRSLHDFLNGSVGKLMLATADQSIFVSNTVLDYFSKFIKFKNHPRLIANGLNTSLFMIADDHERLAIRKRLGVKDDECLNLFVGRFVEKKGLPILHELVKAFPDQKWIFLGHGPIDPLTWSLPNLTVHKNVSHKEIAPYYQAADLLVLPSKGEGFPLVVQEAMACGTPAIVGIDTATALPCLADHIYSADAVADDAAMIWRDAIKKIAAETPQQKIHKRTMVAHIASVNWSWQQCADEYRECIAKLTE